MSRGNRLLVLALLAATFAAGVTAFVASEWRRYATSLDPPVITFDPRANAMRPRVPLTTSLLLRSTIAVVAFTYAFFYLAEAVRTRFDRDSNDEPRPPPLKEPSLPDEIEEMETERMDLLAQERPRAYRIRLLALVLLGYSVLLGVAVACAGCLVAFSIFAIETTPTFEAWKVFPLFGLGLAIVARAVVLPNTPPWGVRIDAAEFPALFDRIERIRRDVQAPRLHEVIVDARMNASVGRTPRFRMLGLWKNTLILGLPVMLGLRSEEFDYVVAHELGHLSLRHPKWTRRQYRLRNAWFRFAQDLARKRRLGGGVLLPFYRWFAGRYIASARALARRHEAEADAIAVAVSGPRAAADAEVRMLFFDERIEVELFEPFVRRMRDEPEPPPSMYSNLRMLLARPIRELAGARRLELQLRFESRSSSTHPSLRDRLRSIGANPRVPPPLEKPVADLLLGTRENELIARLDSQLQEWNRPSWLQGHETWKRKKIRLSELELDGIDSDRFDKARAVEHANLLWQFDRTDEALSAFRRLAANDPTDGWFHYSIGAILLLRNDEAGIEIMREAAARDSACSRWAYARLAAFERRRGNEAAAEEWSRRAHLERIEDALAHEEARDVRATDRLLPHGLTTEAMLRHACELESIDGLARAWLVRKDCAHRSDRIRYVLGVTRKPYLLDWFDARNDCAELVSAVSVTLTLPNCLVVSLERRSVDVGTRIRDAAGGPFYIAPTGAKRRRAQKLDHRRSSALPFLETLERWPEDSRSD